MEALLDTCALLWLGMGGGELSPSVRRKISTADSLYFSSISAWELSRLQREGKVVIPASPETFLEDLCREYGIDEIPLTRKILFRTAQLPMHHRDPADRMIIATALENNLTIVSGDEKFVQYGVEVVK